MTNEKVYKLIEKYNAGNCTEEEKALLDDIYMQLNHQNAEPSQDRIDEIGNVIYRNLPRPDGKSIIIKLWPVIAVAASIALISISVLINYPMGNIVPVEIKSVDEIAPGGNRASLTLANGKIIELSDTKTGVVIGADRITYNDSTNIVDNNSHSVSGSVIVATPKGGEYQITLPDGTRAWLNALSSLRFSIDLGNTKQRKVEAIGEVYFEVAKDKVRPFKVTNGQQEIVVLGTHFNVNGYNLGSIKTTLLEGSVKVAAKNQKEAILLSPGQKCLLNGGRFQVVPADIDVELAWKNGRTEFFDADIKTVMELLERWYNIETDYEYLPLEARFSGSFPRSRNISEVLKSLESTGEVHFKIQERKVLVIR